jgi:hypothetical protein
MPVSVITVELCVKVFIQSRQTKIDHGELIRWTKGFGATNTEGRDVAGMFRQSLEKYVGALSNPPRAVP